MFDRSTVLGAVLDALALLAPGKKPEEFSESTHPRDDLGLKSEDGLDFADIIFEKLKIHVPHEINPFKDDESQTWRNAGQITDLLIQYSTKELAHG